MNTRLTTDRNEAATLAAIHAQCFDDIWSAPSIAALLDTPGTFAVVDKEGLGFILVRVASDESEVLTLGVTPAARRRGIASMLVQDAAEHAARMGASAMFLEVNCSNSPGIALYKRLGFAEVGRRKAYYTDGAGQSHDALVLRVEIPLLRVCNRLQLG